MHDFSKPLILLVEDNDADFETIERAFKKAHFTHEMHRCIDGDDTLNYIFRQGKYQELSHVPLPDLILLDLNMPGIDGREVLCKIKNSLDVQHIPIEILTTSSYEIDINKCYKAGASGYIVKPVDFARFELSIRHLQEYWFSINQLPQPMNA